MNKAASFWALCLAISVPGLREPRRATGAAEFVYADATTACADKVAAQFPGSFRKMQTMMMLLPGPNATALYREVLSAPVNSRNETLLELCGSCGTTAIATGQTVASERWMGALLLDEPVPSDAEVMVVLVLPDETGSELRASLVSLGVLFMDAAQFEDDMLESAKVSNWRNAASTWLVCISLFLSLRQSRSRHPLRLCILILLAMGLVVVVSSSIAAALRIPQNAFSAIVAPMLLGVGVDGVLVILAACNEEKRCKDVWSALPSCAPSIIASAATTCSGFLAGSFVPVRNVATLCMECAISFFVCGLAQLTLFPVLIEVTRLRRSPSKASTRPPQIDFDIQEQLGAHTVSARTLARTAATFEGTPAFMQALVERRDVDWSRLEDMLAAQPHSTVLSWHRLLNSSGLSFEDWMSKPWNSIIFRDEISENASLVSARGILPTNLSVFRRRSCLST